MSIRNEFVERQLKAKKQFQESIGKDVKLCEYCNGIDIEKIPTDLQGHFEICICIKCSCGEKSFQGSDLNKITLDYDEDGLCIGYVCHKCGKQNITGLSPLELSAMSRDDT